MMDSENAYSILMSYALGLLSKRSYTVSGISNKLEIRMKRMHLEESVVTLLLKRILSRLQELHYLNDLHYCERWVEERSRLKPRGKYCLTQELYKKGVPREIIDQFWNSESAASFDETVLAVDLMEKRLPRLKARHSGKALHQKLYATLASKGFSPRSISEALDKAKDQYYNVDVNDVG